MDTELMEYLHKFRDAIHRQRHQLLRDGRHLGEMFVVIPEHFAPAVSGAATIYGMPINTGLVEAPMVRTYL